MSVFVTRERTGILVLKDGDKVIANLPWQSSVEGAYQFWLKKSKEPFDYRSSGWPGGGGDWDESLSEARYRIYQRNKQRAQEMVALLEPHRNAPFIEAEWQVEERRRREQEAAEAVKSLCKVNGDMKAGIQAPERDAAKKAARRAALFAEIDKLIGLKSVKDDVKTMVNHIKIQLARKESGLKTTDLSLHMVFYGNPGTGKTTVARLLAAIYREIGVLSKGHLIETDRSGLVAGYVGQTALKVREVVKRALGGILFIDEAYALTSEEGNDYGAEAIATLLKVMEDYRDKLVVIVAGYPKEMQRFLEANPGLQSRFNKYLTFEDYNAEELTTIFRRFCCEGEYELTPEAEAATLKVFQSACAAKDSRFGNGRLARNCFEHAVNKQANRIASQGNPDRESLTQLRAEDIPNLEALMPILLPSGQ